MANPDKQITVRLGLFHPNPANPSFATDDELARLTGKIRRNPGGLAAMRIAYVTDAQGGGRMVISGNKRLAVLKSIYGEDGEVPADWFTDVTGMTEDQRREFIVNANMSDGQWDYDLLLSQYSRDELLTAGFSSELLDSFGSGMVDELVAMGEEMGNRAKKEADNATIVIHIPAHLLPLWKVYNRKNGAKRIVDFIASEIKPEKKEASS